MTLDGHIVNSYRTRRIVVGGRKMMKLGKVTQLTDEGIRKLNSNPFVTFGEGTMRLSKGDAANILDALNEWDEAIGAKELADNEIGLDYQRWVELKLRLMDFLEKKL